MTDASTSEDMSPERMKVVERAQREPEGRFHSLAHQINVPALLRAYRRIRKDGAVGVDGVTKEQYERLRTKRYRHQPIRRVHIPKDKGKPRPIGISAFEDRVVQDAVREVLQAIYEQDFLECSHGFRSERSEGFGVIEIDGVHVLTWKPGREPRRKATDQAKAPCAAPSATLKAAFSETGGCTLRHQAPSTLSEVAGSPMGPSGRSPRVAGLTQPTQSNL